MAMTTAARRPDDTAPREVPPLDIECFPGLFWDHGDGDGIYFGLDGTTHQCGHQEASELAREEMIILTYRSSNE